MISTCIVGTKDKKAKQALLSYLLNRLLNIKLNYSFIEIFFTFYSMLCI